MHAVPDSLRGAHVLPETRNEGMVARHQGPAGKAYEHALHDVWSVMHRLQGRRFT